MSGQLKFYSQERKIYRMNEGRFAIAGGIHRSYSNSNKII